MSVGHLAGAVPPAIAKIAGRGGRLWPRSRIALKDPEQRRAYQRRYHAERYRRDPAYRARLKASATRWNRRQKDRLLEVIEAARAGGCRCCDELESACLVFHHLRDKEFAIADARRKLVSVATLEAELAKCVVLCANCHAKLHAGLIELANAEMPTPVKPASPVAST